MKDVRSKGVGVCQCGRPRGGAGGGVAINRMSTKKKIAFRESVLESDTPTPPHSIESFFVVFEILFSMYFSHRSLRLMICFVVPLPALNPACPSAIHVSTCACSLFNITRNITLNILCPDRNIFCASGVFTRDTVWTSVDGGFLPNG